MIIDEQFAEAQDKEIAKLRAALERCVDWLEHAPLDYSNGNTACGVDEGNIRGWEGHKQVVDAAKAALSSCESREKK
jgi:hypothetical protein